MAVLLTYDVFARHSELKEALLAKGYQSQWSHNGFPLILPYSAVWCKGTDPPTAVMELRAICKTLGISLLRCVAVEFSSSFGIEGEPY